MSVASSPRRYPPAVLELVLRRVSGDAFAVAGDDPLRDPVGAILREHVPALLDELFGSMDAARLRRSLDALMRLRAVQASSCGEAVAFIGSLREIVADQPRPVRVESGAMPADLCERIAEAERLAGELYTHHRERAVVIRRNEALRRDFVARRCRDRKQCPPSGRGTVETSG